MILSILIPSLESRKEFLNQMLFNLHTQITELSAWDKIEVLTDERSHLSTGVKRNSLLNRAEGKHSWFVDDDDEIIKSALSLILNGLNSNPDVIGINGWMTTDDENRVDWEMKLENPYCATTRDGKEFYLRFPNHIAVMRTEIAKQVKFPDLTMGEDYAWAKEIHDRKLLKTEVIIEEPIYHYKFRSKK
jgi:glycosyltransferase involved in cell wall biosynthesis